MAWLRKFGLNGTSIGIEGATPIMICLLIGIGCALLVAFQPSSVGPSSLILLLTLAIMGVLWLYHARARDEAQPALQEGRQEIYASIHSEILLNHIERPALIFDQNGQLSQGNISYKKWAGIEDEKPAFPKEMIPELEAFLYRGLVALRQAKKNAMNEYTEPALPLATRQSKTQQLFEVTLARLDGTGFLLQFSTDLNKAGLEKGLIDNEVRARAKLDHLPFAQIDLPIAYFQLKQNKQNQHEILFLNDIAKRLSPSLLRKGEIAEEIFGSMEYSKNEKENLAKFELESLLLGEQILTLRPKELTERPYLRSWALKAQRKGNDINEGDNSDPQGEDIIHLFCTDITEEKCKDIELLHGRKMQSLGRLAGGVAHDLRNIVQAIQLNVDTLFHRHPVGDPTHQELQTITQSCARAESLISKLLAFSRRQTFSPKIVDLGEQLSIFIPIIRRMLGETIEVELNVARDVPRVKIDPAQFEASILSNLATNARDAMLEKKGGGKLVLTLHSGTEMDAKQVGIDHLRAGDYAVIEVRDNGGGITPENLDRILDPFFTTKPQGKGTGLGLSAVYGTVAQMGGAVGLQNEINIGVTFLIFLPSAQEMAEGGEGEAKIRSVDTEDKVERLTAHIRKVATIPDNSPLNKSERKEKQSAAKTDMSGQACVLLVEDEDLVRKPAASLLRSLGYEVLEAEDGEIAAEMMQDETEKIDLIVTDIVMPVKTGPEFIREVRDLLQDRPVIFVSGYADEPAEVSELLELEQFNFLAKPYRIKELARCVKGKLS